MLEQDFTVDDGPKIFHLLDVVIIWSPRRSDFLKDLLSQPREHFRVHRQEVDDEGERGRGLFRVNEIPLSNKEISDSPYLCQRS